MHSSKEPLKERIRAKITNARYKWTPSRMGAKLLSFLPIVSWLPQYDWTHSFFGDLSGGLTMAVFSVPQGIALAGIAGVPPVYGLYTAIFPSFLYIFFGTSKHNALGGFAVLSLMTHAAIENVVSYNDSLYAASNQTTTGAPEDYNDILNSTMLNDTNILDDVVPETWQSDVASNPVKKIQVATTIVFLAGVIQILMAVFRLQYLTSLFSEQVMSGFVVGGGIHVLVAQMGDLLGFQLPRRSGPGYLYYRIYDIWENLSNIHIPTLSISVSSILFLVFGKEVLSPWMSTAFLFPIPFELVLAVVGTSATNYAELSKRHNIKVVGNIPTEFPPPSLPRFDLITFIGPNAVAIAITAVAIHITVAKVAEKRYKYKINHGQELYALGFVGVLSSMFPVFPVTSGFARSVVGAAVGGSTQLTCLFSSLTLIFVLLCIGPALEYLPKSVLASMIVVSQKGMFMKFAELPQLWPVFKIDFAIWVMSMLLTVCYDLGPGLLLAIGFAVLTTIIRTQWPRWHVLSRDRESDSPCYRETKKKELEFVEGNVCVFRMDAPLIFTSVDHFAASVWQCVKRWEQSKLESFVTIDQMNSAQNDDVFDNKLRAARRRWRKEGRPEERCSLVIDCTGFPYVDYLGLNTLKMAYTDLMSVGVQTYLVTHKRDLLHLFEATDFYEEVDRDRIFQTLEAAVTYAQLNVPEKPVSKETLTALASILTTDTQLEDDEEEETEESPEKEE